MLVNKYFLHLKCAIDACITLTAKEQVVEVDERLDYLGFFKAALYFPDWTVLHIKEFVFTRFRVERETYAYLYQDGNAKKTFDIYMAHPTSTRRRWL